MFDHFKIAPSRVEYVPYTQTVNHKYAPTTEQAKYLQQLQTEAWDSVKDQIVRTIEGNFLGSAEVHRYTDCRHREEKVMAIFTLNGKKFEIEVCISDDSLSGRFDERLFMETLCKAMSEKIMMELLRECDFRRQR